MDALEAISTRRSIRQFAETPVTDEQLDVLLRAAMAAPSAGNEQVWRFIVIRDAETRAKLAVSTPFGSPMGRATLGIVVVGDTSAETFPGNWANDCAAAVENLLLAAHAIGLGAVWLGVHPGDERESAVAAIVGTPPHVRPFCMVAIGVPAKPGPDVDRYHAEYVLSESWSE